MSSVEAGPIELQYAASAANGTLATSSQITTNLNDRVITFGDGTIRMNSEDDFMSRKSLGEGISHSQTTSNFLGSEGMGNMTSQDTNILGFSSQQTQGYQITGSGLQITDTVHYDTPCGDCGCGGSFTIPCLDCNGFCGFLCELGICFGDVLGGIIDLIG